MQEEEQGLGESGRRYLDVIRRSTERLHALVEDLLLIAQIEAKRVELQLAPVDVAELTLARGRGDAADRRRQGRDARASSPIIRRSCRGDSNRLTQVLDNLVSNAVKFTNDGGTVTVSVARRRRRRAARRRRHRHRRPARRAGPGVLALLPRVDGDAARDPGHRPRALDLARARRAARRHDHVREPGGRGHAGRRHPPAVRA